MNLAEWLVRTARRTPDAPALLHGSQVVATYAEFAERAASIGAALRICHGVGRGDRVALTMGNCTAYLEALYGIWFAGAVAVPINYKLHPREMAFIIADSGARLVLTGDDADGIDCDVPKIAVSGPRFEKMRRHEAMAEPAPLPSDALAWLFYTSGTTGRPKGVMLTVANLQAMTFSYFVDVDEVFARDAALYAAPMSHGAGLYNFMHVLRGSRHVVPLSGGFDTAEILGLAGTVGNLSMFAAPTMVRRLVSHAKAIGHDGAGIRTIVYGGGPMYVADIEEAVDTLGARFVQIYGQGETPMTITALSRDEIVDRSHPRWRERLGSVGRAQSVVEVRVADEAGRTVAAGESGEILVRGPSVMAGYWRNEEATAESLRDGWLWTGDVGAMDADGYLTLMDRSKDVIISGGTNIYPREVEEVLLRHPSVAEVSVVGRPSAEWGEDVVAFVVAAEGATPDEADLDAHCRDEIARFKRPKAYVLVPELPKNNYGKVLKTELRKQLES
ncbi:class I adenylate-forming enzyme family protein [Amorphus orientalis]|uniref:3-methylmercaptopropionyl-CoA ligase n=1 Tax=Amorphus orientalis TaxID=649198 RepID=A0AAE3VRN2_9HYPH|nr:AMP-binding protein [Amorphus orientalis]MDQ0316912.1 long-chain acyl-CoA synthetase [Amorphus orientalis]